MFNRKISFIVMSILALFLCLQFSSMVNAQDAKAGGDGLGQKKLTFFQFIKGGGPIFAVILICSMFAVGLIFDRFTYFKNATVKEEKKFIDALMKTSNIKMSMTLCDRTTGALPRVVKVALVQYEKGSDRKKMEEEIEAQILSETIGMERRLPQLDTMVTLTPLLGLLGTVIGMIGSFNVVASVGMGKPELLAGGIAEALINTAGGLAVAIPSLFCYNLLNGRKEQILMSIEKNVTLLLLRLEEFKVEAGKQPESTGEASANPVQ